MIVASVLHKLSPYYSFGRWLATHGLKRYRPPSDSILKPHVTSNRDKKKTTSTSLDGSLIVPKSAKFNLETTPVKELDLQMLHYSSEFQWLVDISCAALMVYIATATYYRIKPSAIASEYNLSTIWIIAVGIITFLTLASLTRVYFSKDLEKERVIGVVSAMFFFVCALVILVIDESVIEFGLERTHKDMTNTLQRLLETLIKDPTNVTFFPKWAFKFFLAIIAAIFSAVLTFPGFQFAEIHFEALQASRSIFGLKTVLHLCYISPMFCLVLWVKPLSKDMLTREDYVHIFEVPVSYESFRLGTLVFVCLLRVFLYQVYLQSYLNRAKSQMEALRRERGRVNISDLRRRVSSIFAFYSGAALEYIAPVLILLLLSILLYLSSDYHLYSHEQESASISTGGNPFKVSGFGIGIFHGCISFMCWWACFTYFVTAGFGSVIRTYLYM